MRRIFIFFFCSLCLTEALSAQQEKPRFIVQPYLQYATQYGIHILWETSDLATTLVQYGPAKFNTGSANLSMQKAMGDKAYMHHVELTGLQPQTNYFYRVISIFAGGDTLMSDISSFQTVVKDSSAFAFAVFSDSQFDQEDPGAWNRVSMQAWKERPNFALHAGDLVDLGYLKKDWVDDFFTPAGQLMKHIPVYSIPGNHEHDAAYYYQYMFIPNLYYYSFRYGNAEIFMIDTNQYQEEGTDLYNWLDQALAKSTATWKIVVHHHPPYSSDEDDFGNTNAEESTLGDEEARHLTSLYDKYGVDLVFYGHIHTYERSWPVYNGKTVNENGVVYINVGGAGGGLEKAAPARSWFTNKVKTIHHFGYVAVNGNTLQFQAIDDSGMIFDSFTLTESRKNRISKTNTPAIPVINTTRRIFADTMQVSFIPAFPGEEIRYTLNGTDPGRKSDIFKGKIILDKTGIVKAAAFNKYGSSRINTITFTKEKMYESVSLPDPEPGLIYNYFTGTIQDEDTGKFTSLRFSRHGVVPVPDPSALPHRRQYWGAVFEGYIKVPADGYYRFYGHADHILRLHIHEKLLFEELDREINYEGEIYLKAGYHPVKIDYYNSRADRAFLEIYYSGPGIEKQVLPNTVLFR